MRLLLVEDNVPLVDELLAGLQRQGYAVDWLADGRDAVYRGRSEPIGITANSFNSVSLNPPLTLRSLCAAWGGMGLMAVVVYGGAGYLQCLCGL